MFFPCVSGNKERKLASGNSKRSKPSNKKAIVRIDCQYINKKQFEVFNLHFNFRWFSKRSYRSTTNKGFFIIFMYYFMNLIFLQLMNIFIHVIILHYFLICYSYWKYFYKRKWKLVFCGFLIRRFQKHLQFHSFYIL